MPRTQSQEALTVEDEPQRVSGIPPWTLTLIVAAVVLIVAIALGTLAGTDIQIGPAPQVTVDPFGVNDDPAAAQPVPAEPAPEPAPQPAPAAEQEYGTLRAGDDLLLPIPPGGLAPYAGRQVRGLGVPVQAVVADEGFWVGENTDDRIYVIYRIADDSESPPDINPGQRVTFDGTVDTVDTSTSLETPFRLTEAEGLSQVYAQGYVIGVRSVAIAQEPTP